jgi:hypothetical protein
MDIASRFVLPGALLLITYASGFWLTAVGRPYQGLPFNLHKLIALGAVVFAVLRFYDPFKGGPVPYVVVVLTVLGVASVVALFLTGALLSVGNLPHAPLLLAHRVALVALPLSVVPVGAILLAGFNA